MSDPTRAPERRQENLGAPGGQERRSLSDRRREQNALYVQFRIGDLTFLLEILSVQEVLKAQEMTAVPLSPSLIAGLINLRGEIVPALNLRPLLGQAGELKESDMNVIIRSEEGLFSLIADEIHDVLEASPTMMAPPPPNLAGCLKDLTLGVYKLPGSLLLLLDIQGLLRLVEAGSPLAPNAL